MEIFRRIAGAKIVDKGSITTNNPTYILQREIPRHWVQRMEFEAIQRILHRNRLPRGTRRHHLHRLLSQRSWQHAVTGPQRCCPVPVRHAEIACGGLVARSVGGRGEASGDGGDEGAEGLLGWGLNVSE